jgi:hypothetical protein
LLKAIADTWSVRLGKTAAHISPGKFNLKPPAPSIVPNAADLNIFHKLTLDRQWINAVHAVADPVPTAGAPMEIRIQIDIHFGFNWEVQNLDC